MSKINQEAQRVTAHPVVPAVEANSANRAMFIVIAASTLVFSWLAYLQYAYFTTETHEIMYLSYGLAHAGRGGLLPSYFVPNGDYFGSHVNITWLVMIPLFKLIPTVPFLLFVQSLWISLSAWPLYLLARHQLKDGFAAVAIATAYLLFPPVASQHLNQVHDDQFANLWLLLAAYLFVRKQYGRFLIPIVLVCFTKEYFAMTVVMFGLWAFLERRSWKWVAGPVIIGIGSFLLAVKVIMPCFRGPAEHMYSSLNLLSEYGSTPGEVLRKIVSDPGRFIGNTFGPPKLWYLFVLLGPVLWILPFSSSAIVLSVPNLLMNLAGTGIPFTQISWHYGVFLSAALYVSLVHGLPRTIAWFAKRLGGTDYGVARAIAIMLLVGSVLSHPLWLDINKFRRPPHLETLRQVVAMIPRDASVICPGPMLAHFSHQRAATRAGEALMRKRAGAMSNFAPLPIGHPEEMLEGADELGKFDYIIVDANWRDYYALAQQSVIDWVNRTHSFRLIFNRDGLYVFQRSGQSVP